MVHNELGGKVSLGLHASKGRGLHNLRALVVLCARYNRTSRTEVVSKAHVSNLVWLWLGTLGDERLDNGGCVELWVIFFFRIKHFILIKTYY